LAFVLKIWILSVLSVLPGPYRILQLALDPFTVWCLHDWLVDPDFVFGSANVNPRRQNCLVYCSLLKDDCLKKLLTDSNARQLLTGTTVPVVASWINLCLHFHRASFAYDDVTNTD
jgi:hypothetical protein